MNSSDQNSRNKELLTRDGIEIVAKLDDLETEIKRLNSEIRRVNSMSINIKLGIVRGFFTALGATIIFALAVIITDRVLSNLESVPVIETIIKKLPLKELIDSAQ